MKQPHKTTTKARTIKRSAIKAAAAKTRSTSDRRPASQPRPKQISLKQLSPQRRDLFVCMYELGRGKISTLKVNNGEPILDRRCICEKPKLAMEQVRKPISMNFKLKEPHLMLLKRLDEIGTGVLKGVTFEDGRPYSICN